MKHHGISYYLFLTVLPDQRPAHQEISPCSRWPGMCADKVSLSKTTLEHVQSYVISNLQSNSSYRYKKYNISKTRKRFFFFFTSTYRHLSCPSAVTLADSVFRTPRQEEAMLTAVHQGVAKTRQIHPHHVHMERALWLLTCMGWWVEKGHWTLESVKQSM